MSREILLALGPSSTMSQKYFEPTYNRYLGALIYFRPKTHKKTEPFITLGNLNQTRAFKEPL